MYSTGGGSLIVLLSGESGRDEHFDGEWSVTNRSLSQRLRHANFLLIAAVIVLGTTSITSLIALRIETGNAIEEYREMQMLKHAEEGLQRAELQLRMAEIDTSALVGELSQAREQLVSFIAVHADEENEGEVEAERERVEVEAAQVALDQVVTVLSQLASYSGAIPDPDGLYLAIDTERDRIRRLAIDPDLARVQQQATRETWLSVIVVGVISILIITVTILISRALHRQIVGSIRRLQIGAREIALGHFARRVDEQGDEEIVALARDFNQMATQLDALYRDMERRIELKSRELVRSERLASVGFLAAGVAHEINNPLGIINGYATMARGWLAGTPDPKQIEESCQAFGIIGEEAFRCKKIVEQLVTLSMVGDGTREQVSLRQVVDDLVTLVRGLERSRARKIEYEPDPHEQAGDQYMVLANPVELKQVVLNLIVNALDATEELTGRVLIHLHRSKRRVLLTVTDNGCGIGAEKIENVFEPFFTNHSNGEHHRLGLGLTISHAIVEAHNGHLRVRSDGLGQGTRFIVDLPDENEETDPDGNPDENNLEHANEERT